MSEETLFVHAESERMVLGAVLIDNAAMHQLGDALVPRHFSDAKHVAIWGAMLALYERSQPIDIVTVKNELADGLDAAGGTAYLSGLEDGMPRVANVGEWARIVIDKARRRYARSFAVQFLAEVDNSGIETEELIERMQAQLTRLQNARRDGVVAIRDVIPQSLEWLDKFATSRDAMLGIPCGLPDIDRMLCGWQKGALYVLAARPSRGKSILCSQASVYAAAHGFRVLYVGMEMVPKATTVRMLCGDAAIDRWDLRYRSAEDPRADEAWNRVNRSAARMREFGIYFDQRPQPTIAQIRAVAKQHQAARGLDLLVVDYMQRCGRPSGVDDWQNVGDVAVGLKSLAQSLDIPVLAACQLGTRAEEKRPTQDDLAQAKQRISAEADVIVFLHPEQTEEWRKHDYPNVWFIVDKHRDGATGDIRLSFERPFNRFVQMAEVPDVQQQLPRGDR